MNKTIFLTAKIKREEKTLKDVLKKAGIVYPHPSLGFFHFIYSPLEDSNQNGVRLAEEAVEKSIAQLKATQANINHERVGGCGSILDAWVNKDDEIEIVVGFFKNLYPEEYEQALEDYKNNNLFVSFELRTDTNSIELMADGTRRLHDIDWEGVGILLGGVKPAYPNARALDMAMKQIENLFQSEDKALVYASAKDISKKWIKLGQLIEETLSSLESNKEEIEAAKWTTKYINTLPNSSFAVIEPAYLNGDTDDKRARHLPFKDKNGKVDLPHYKNALARVNQIKPITDSISQTELIKKAKAILNKYKNILKTKKGEINVDKKAQEALLAKFKEDITKELGEDAVKDWSDEQWIAELEKRANAEESTENKTKETVEEENIEKKDEEAKTSYECECLKCGKVFTSAEHCKDTKCPECGGDSRRKERPGSGQSASENVESKSEKAERKVEQETTTKTTSITDDAGKETVVEEILVVQRVDDKEVYRRKTNEERMYAEADVEAIKAEFQTKIDELKATLEAKDSEIKEVRENAEKIASLKIEMKDNEFTAEFKDEDWLNEEKIQEAKSKKEQADVIAKNKEELKDNEYAKEFKDEDYLDEAKVENAKLKKLVDELKSKKSTEIASANVDTKEEFEASAQETEDQVSFEARREFMKKRTGQIK